MNPDWIVEVIDAEGALLKGKFVNGEVLFIKVTYGFKQYYGHDKIMRLNVPIYGTKQEAYYFYKALVEKVEDRKYCRSKADPCLYYIWKNGRLAIMLSWVDDILCLVHPEDVNQIHKDLESAFKCTS